MSGRNASVGVLLIDLDRFRRVNHSFGFAVGDSLLSEIARRMQNVLSGRGILYSLGGDRFAVLTNTREDGRLLLELGEQLRRATMEPFDAVGRRLRVGASVGIASSEETGLEPEGLLREAEVALERAKELGGNRCQLIDSVTRQRLLETVELEGELRLALDADALSVHYQPIVRLDGAITGVEALARWSCPGRGRVSPSEFIPVAEGGDLIEDVGRVVLRAAADQVSRWRRRVSPELQLSVNLSARQLADPSLLDVLNQLLEETGLPHSALCLELTETALLDDPITAENSLGEIHDTGIRIAVDDFGVGYSSLLYVRSFPVDIMKIDKQFVSGLGRDTTDGLILGSIIDLAHSLGITTVAEGIETVEQLRVLRTLNCDEGQGFYFARPCGSSRMGTLLPHRLPADVSSTGTSRGDTP